jgi:hypothetical protein
MDNLEAGSVVQKSVQPCFNTLNIGHASRPRYPRQCACSSDTDVECDFPNVKTNPTLNSILNLYLHYFQTTSSG